jgi:hypothetical protein
MKKRGAKKAFKEGHTSPYSEVCLNYGLKREVKFRTGEGASDKLLSLVDEFFDANRILKNEQVFTGFSMKYPKTTAMKCVVMMMSWLISPSIRMPNTGVISSHLS